jgi:hypothetical protein
MPDLKRPELSVLINQARANKKSVQRKQKIAGWVEEYLLEILLGGTKLAKF